MKMQLSSAPVWPPLPTAQDKIAEYVKKVDTWTNYKILNGFDYAVRGTTYHFGYDLFDQSNFSQANSSAIMSVTLGAMSKEDLIASYGADAEGNVDKANLPVALPEDWKMVWQGHIYEGGVDTSVGLTFNAMEFLALATAAGLHNQSNLAIGWEIKTALRAATTVEAVEAVAKQYAIEDKFREASVKK